MSRVFISTHICIPVCGPLRYHTPSPQGCVGHGEARRPIGWMTSWNLFSFDCSSVLLPKQKTNTSWYCNLIWNLTKWEVQKATKSYVRTDAHSITFRDEGSLSSTTSGTKKVHHVSSLNKYTSESMMSSAERKANLLRERLNFLKWALWVAWKVSWSPPYSHSLECCSLSKEV